MPIPAQDVADRMRFALDAENSDHYRDDLDIIPAINASIDWLTAIINATLGDKKFGEEIFSDLTQTRVFKTTEDSRLSLNVFPDPVWTILAVYPKPTTKSNGSPVIIQADLRESVHLSDLYHISSSFSAKRLSVEEWSVNVDNPFEKGYDGDQICDALKEYAYLDPSDYESFPNTLPPVSQKQKEIEVRPTIPNENLTVYYAKEPTKITALTDNVEFPVSALPLLTAKALAYTSWKQGDQTNLFTVTQLDINNLLASVN